MERGAGRLRRVVLHSQQEDAWWRTSYLLAEIRNDAIAQIKAWGVGKEERPVKPRDLNPLEQGKQASLSQQITADRETESAFDFAQKREAAKHVKQILD